MFILQRRKLIIAHEIKHVKATRRSHIQDFSVLLRSSVDESQRHRYLDGLCEHCAVFGFDPELVRNAEVLTCERRRHFSE